MIGVAVLAAGCGDLTGPRAELADARNRWNTWGPAVYSLTLSRSCECTAEMTGPVLVTVDRTKNMESRIYAASGAPVVAPFADAFPAVEGLFALIQRMHDEGAHSVVVQYDPILGYPRSISVDQHPVMVDDEFTYRISLTPP